LVSIARSVLKIHNPNDSTESLCDAFLNYAPEYRDRKKADILAAINQALLERRATA
jgi:hypothetical protein